MSAQEVVALNQLATALRDGLVQLDGAIRELAAAVRSMQSKDSVVNITTTAGWCSACDRIVPRLDEHMREMHADS